MLPTNKKACLNSVKHAFSVLNQAGFTIVELIVVILILGILSATALPRFFQSSSFQVMVYRDSASSAVRYARELATNSRCDTRVQVTASGYNVWQRATSCDVGEFTRLAKRYATDTWSDTAPSGLTVSAIDIYFDAKGQPYSSSTGGLMSSTTTLTIDGRDIIIYPYTGFVKDA